MSALAPTLPSRSLAVAALALLGLLTAAAPPAAAQTVRFETNAGFFDVLLNPTNDVNLQVHVDNFLGYVEQGLYNDLVINRADGGANPFVVQLGTFGTTGAGISDPGLGGFFPIPDCDVCEPAIVDGGDAGLEPDFPTLSNTSGTVALALGAFPGTNTTDPNSGTSSFFINLNDANTFLDASGFVPFARVDDISFLLSLVPLAVDISAQAGAPGSLAFTDVPILPSDEFVVVERAFVVIPEPGSLAITAAAMAAVVSTARRRRTAA